MPGRTGARRCATRPINYRCTFFMCIVYSWYLHPLCTVCTTIAPRVLHFSAVHIIHVSIYPKMHVVCKKSIYLLHAIHYGLQWKYKSAPLIGLGNSVWYQLGRVQGMSYNYHYCWHSGAHNKADRGAHKLYMSCKIAELILGSACSSLLLYGIPVISV